MLGLLLIATSWIMQNCKYQEVIERTPRRRLIVPLLPSNLQDLCLCIYVLLLLLLLFICWVAFIRPGCMD